MQALNVNSSESGATITLRIQIKSQAFDNKNIGSEYNFHKPDKPCMHNGPRNNTIVKNRGKMDAGNNPGSLRPNNSKRVKFLKWSRNIKFLVIKGDRNIITKTLQNLFFIVAGWFRLNGEFQTYKLATNDMASKKQANIEKKHGYSANVSD